MKRRFAPTPVLAGLVLAAAAPWAVEPWWPGIGWLTALLDGALLLLAILSLAEALRRPPRVAFRHPAVLSLGREAALHLEIDPGVPWATRVRAVLPFPETWEGEPEASSLRIPAWGRGAFEWVVRPLRRGRTALGPVSVRVRSRWGLWEAEFRPPQTSEIKVYPAVHDVEKYGLLARQRRLVEMGLRALRRVGVGTDFAHLRDSYPDEDMRRVDWKATARRGRLISREYQVERGQTVILALDAGRMLTEVVDGIPKIEYALHGAILLAHVAARFDDRVGALIFDEEIRRFVPPRKGAAAVPTLLEGLFDVEPRLVEPDYERAMQFLALRHRRRSLVFLLTNLVDQETSGLALGAMMAAARHHRVVCVALGDRETREAAARPVEDLDDLLRRAGATYLRSERHRAIRRLERAGIPVVDAEAGRVPVELVNRYLELKARGLL